LHPSARRATTNHLVAPLGSACATEVSGVATANVAAPSFTNQSSYRSAPLTAVQEKVTFADGTVASFAGAISDGSRVAQTGGGAVMIVSTLAVLLPLSGSAVGEVTVTRLVIVPVCCGARTVMAMVLLAPASTTPPQATEAAPKQFQLPALTLTNCTPCGSSSVNVPATSSSP
jgi:hypothetical protein